MELLKVQLIFCCFFLPFVNPQVPVVSPRCSIFSARSPCSDLCDNPDTHFRPDFGTTLTDPLCFTLEAFPMYSSLNHNQRVHVRFRLKLDKNWNLIGIWRSPAPELNKATCPDEDDVVEFNRGATSVGQVTFPMCSGSGKLTTYLRHQPSNAGLDFDPFDRFGANHIGDPGFCSTWGFPEASATSLTAIRFIGEIILVQGAEIYSPGESQYMLKVQSPVYFYHASGKSSTAIPGCHNAALHAEYGSNLATTPVQPVPILPTTTTKPTTTTTQPTTTTTQPTTSTLNTTTKLPIIIKPKPTIIITSFLNGTEGPPIGPVTLTEETKGKNVRKKKRLYDECELTKRCIAGQNPDCISAEELRNLRKQVRINRGRASCVMAENCPFLVTFGKQEEDGVEITSSQILIEMTGESIFWIAVGFSMDDTMGNDFVVECVNDNSEIRVYTSWNSVRDNKRMPYEEDKNPFVKKLSGSFFEKSITCAFVMERKIKFGSIILDLERNGFKTIMAYGATQGSFVGPLGNINYHGLVNRLYSPVNYHLADQFGPSNYQQNLIHWHGYIMTIVWILIVPMNNFLCRHYKETFQATKICGVKVWLFAHVVLECSGMFLLILGHGLLTEANNSWHSLTETYVDDPNYHLWFSLAASSLYFTNFFTGAIIKERLRGQPKSWYSANIGHSIVGHASYVCSLASIYASSFNLQANLPCSINTLIVIWGIIYHFYLFLIMGYHGLWVNWMINLVVNTYVEPMHLYQTPKQHARAESPGSRWRKYNLAIFLVLCITFCILMLVFVKSDDEEGACYKLEQFHTAPLGDRVVNADCAPASK